MRLGLSSSDEFIQALNEKTRKIQAVFLERIKDLTKMITIKVMLSDSTIIDQKTFDPQAVRNYYESIIKNFPDWTIQGVSVTNNEDVRRLFVKLEIKDGNHVLLWHMSLQYHVLLYYKPDNKVIECQKELAEIVDKTKDAEAEITEIGDQLISEKLKNIGHSDLDHQKLFELFFENDEFREEIYKEIKNSSDVDFQHYSKRKTELFNELDGLLLETYQTTPILIDDVRLIGGEEGGLCSFDLEYIKNKIREGNFDPKKISASTKDKIIQRFDQILQILSV
ncbi:MAG: hypothetical protein FJ356_04570 [Thaumarchaeota archaeon]|nr:hypothetical protein [Nitrososphaerota archaeon]